MKTKFQYVFYNKNPEKICKFCGVNTAITDMDILEFFHSDCWKMYRKSGLVYKIPENFNIK